MKVLKRKRKEQKIVLNKILRNMNKNSSKRILVVKNDSMVHKVYLEIMENCVLILLYRILRVVMKKLIVKKSKRKVNLKELFDIHQKLSQIKKKKKRM